MAKIIYKQRHVGENGRKFSPSRNAHYVQYIGEREHVLKKSHQTNLVKYIGEREHAAKQMAAEPENGLFGYIEGKFSDDYKTADMQTYVRKMSSPHRNVFHSIFSFTPESAEEAGLNTLEDWENWTKYHITDIANGNNMKIENIEYLAAVHLKEGQPHVHIMWWDKKQQVLINKVDPLACDKVRISAIKGTYRELFNEIYDKEEKMHRSLRRQIGEYALRKISEGFNDEYSSAIADGIRRIVKALPPKGQLKYKFMAVGSPAKSELDKLTHYIIDNNPDFKKQYDEICELRLMYNKLLHSEDTNYGKLMITTYMNKVNDKIENAVGNEILRFIKSEKQAGHLDEILFGPSQNKNKQVYHDEAPLFDDESELYHGEAPSNGNESEPYHDDPPIFYDESEPPNDEPSSKTHKEYIKRSPAINSAREAVKNKEYEKALKLFTEESDKGNVLATYEIADLYRRGLCSGDAFEVYRKALEGFLRIEPTLKQKAYIHYRIGRMYYDGYGTDKDLVKAFFWLKRSADEQNHLSEFTVGKMLCNGQGTDKDIFAGMGYLNKAAQANNSYAMLVLAKMYINYPEVRDLDIAVQLLNNAKAVNKNLRSLADYTLGTIYLYSDEKHDVRLAMEHLSRAAEAGNEYAQKAIDNHEAFTQTCTVRMVDAVSRILSQNLEDSRSALQDCSAAVFGRGDLSKEQIRELMLKLQDKENTAEM